MSRVRNLDRLEKIYRYVEANPGTSKRMVSEAVGLNADNMESYLASMEGVGMYLSEDARGRLYPYGRFAWQESV